jgi:Ceramidase
MTSLRLRTRWIILAAIAIAACGITAMLKPISQPGWYHHFADARTLLGVPRAQDVLSNIPFVAVGLAGLYYTLRSRTQNRYQRWALAVMFAGLFLTGFGSGYYHLAPDNQRLVWDRLPMTLAMAGIIVFLLANRFARMSWWILPLLVLVGAGSVGHWAWSESRGVGDLRWYLLFQTLTFVVATALVLMFPATGEPKRALAIALAANVLAKIFELLDQPIFAIGGIVSGHTLKHLAAALGFIPLIVWLARTAANTEEEHSERIAAQK